MPTSYGQYCPVAKAMEILDERWTLLVVRELMLGSQHFNALRRGVPRMSPALLSKRLQMLVRCGVVERRQDGARVAYHLTEAGRELEPIVLALGRWGLRWIDQLGEEDLDPHVLLWDIQRGLDLEAMPAGRTVVHFQFSDPALASGAKRWWLVVSSETVDLCDVDPGYPVTVTVSADLRTLVAVWRGDLGWSAAVRGGELGVDGPTWAQRALPRWLKLSPLAATPRPVPVPA